MSTAAVTNSTAGLQHLYGLKHRPKEREELIYEARSLEEEDRQDRLKAAKRMKKIGGWVVLFSIVATALLAMPLNIAQFSNMFTYMDMFAGESWLARVSNYVSAVLLTTLGVVGGVGVIATTGVMRVISALVMALALMASYFATNISYQGTTQNAFDGAKRTSIEFNMAREAKDQAKINLSVAQAELTAANAALNEASAKMRTGAEQGEFNRRQKPAYDQRIQAAQTQVAAARLAYERRIDDLKRANEGDVKEGPQATFDEAAPWGLTGKEFMAFLNKLFAFLVTASPVFCGMLAGAMLKLLIQSYYQDAEREDPGARKTPSSSIPQETAQPTMHQRAQSVPVHAVSAQSAGFAAHADRTESTPDYPSSTATGSPLRQPIGFQLRSQPRMSQPKEVPQPPDTQTDADPAPEGSTQTPDVREDTDAETEDRDPVPGGKRQAQFEIKLTKLVDAIQQRLASGDLMEGDQLTVRMTDEIIGGRTGTDARTSLYARLADEGLVVLQDIKGKRHVIVKRPETSIPATLEKTRGTAGGAGDPS